LNLFRTFIETFKTDEKNEVKEEVRIVDSYHDPTPIIPIRHDSDSEDSYDRRDNSDDSEDSRYHY